MNHNAPFTMAIPTYFTDGLTEAVTAIRDVLALDINAARARDSDALRQLTGLIETLRRLSL